MRSLPSCWDIVLAQLGLKRKSNRHRSLQRGPHFLARFEKLEPRHLLSATTSNIATEEIEPSPIVYSYASLPPEIEQVSDGFVLSGNSSDYFSVSSREMADDASVAILELVPDADTTRELEHKFEVLRVENSVVVDHYEVTVSIIGSEFLANYNSHRDREASKAATIYRTTNLDPAKALLAEVGQHLSASNGSIDLDSRMSIYERVDTLPETRGVASVYSTLGERRTELADLSIEELANLEWNPNGSPKEQPKRFTQQSDWGNLAILLSEQLTDDLSSLDSELQSMAERVRSKLAANASFSRVFWRGLGVNSSVQEIKAEDHTNDTVHEVIYDGGLVSLVEDDFAIELDTPAIVTGRRISRGLSSGYYMAAAGAQSGGSMIQDPTEDNWIYNNSTSPVIDSTTTIVGSGTNPSDNTQRDYEGYLKFNLSGYSQYTDQATITLQAFATSSSVGQNGVIQQAEVVYDNDWNEDNIFWGSQHTPSPNYGSANGIEQSDKTYLISPVAEQGEESIDHWVITNSASTSEPTTVELDVSDYVRHIMRQGDADFDFDRGVSDILDDVSAFELAVKDRSAYDEAFGKFFGSDQQLLDRLDLNRDEAIDGSDGNRFLRINGLLPGDVNFDGIVDGGDYFTIAQGNQQDPAYVQGDVNFDNIKNGLDIDIWAHYYGITPPLESSEEITIRVFSPQRDPSNVPLVAYGAKEMSSSEEHLRPKLEVTQPTDVIVTDFGATADGKFEVSYNVVNHDVQSITFAVLAKANRDEGLAEIGELLMTNLVDSVNDLDTKLGHTLSFDSEFLASIDSDSYFTVQAFPWISLGSPAETNTTNNVKTFSSGAIINSDGKVFVHGTEVDDVIAVYSDRVELSTSGATEILTWGSGGEQVVVDDTDGSSFTTDSNWELLSNGSRYSDTHRVTAAPDRWASWSFNGLEPGLYNVYATWQAHATNRAPYAPYSIYSDSEYVLTDQVDQHFLPDDDVIVVDGSTAVSFQQIGNKPIAVRENGLEVVLNTIGGWTSADAIHIERISEISGLQVHAHGGDDVAAVAQSVIHSVAIYGGAGADTLVGGSGDDFLDGGNDNDVLSGGIGDDTYSFNGFGDLGIDEIFESSNQGTDLFDFSRSSSMVGVRVDLSETGTAPQEVLNDGAVSLQLLLDSNPEIENVRGSSANDILIGNSLSNFMDGGEGNDTVDGAEGSDELLGGAGMDLIIGGADNDILRGGQGSDTYKYSGTVYLGNDFIDEGMNDGTIDLFDFSEFSGPTWGGVDLNLSTLDENNPVELRVLSHPLLEITSATTSPIEVEAAIGTSFADILRGNSSRNNFYGGDGDDELYGKEGHDVLHGELGSDIVYGQEGFDTLEVIDGGATAENSPGFSSTSEWITDNAKGHNGQQLTVVNGAGANALWSFTDVTPDDPNPTVDVFVTWDNGGATNLATSAQFVVRDAFGNQLATVPTVDFNESPFQSVVLDRSDLLDNDWRYLGTFTNLNGGLQVELTATSSDVYLADAVLVMPSSAAIDPPVMFHVMPKSGSSADDELVWLPPNNVEAFDVIGYEVQRSDTGLGLWSVAFGAGSGADELDEDARSTAGKRLVFGKSQFNRLRIQSSLGGSEFAKVNDDPVGDDLITERIDSGLNGEDRIVNVSASSTQINATDAVITVEWLVEKHHAENTTSPQVYDIYRKNFGPGGGDWQILPSGQGIAASEAVSAGGILQYADNVSVGDVFEYLVVRRSISDAPSVTDSANYSQGIVVAAAYRSLDEVESRGTLILVVAEDIEIELAPEIARLKQDLQGDGWKVSHLTAEQNPPGGDPNDPDEDSGYAVSLVKQQIKATYDLAGDARGIFLLGNVPVPYSSIQGYQATTPADNHNRYHEGRRTFASDVYYGDLDQPLIVDANSGLLVSPGWTDENELIRTVTMGDLNGQSQNPESGTGTVDNLIGDGRFDNATVPQDDDGLPMEAFVGRVDLSKMSSFGSDFGNDTLSGFDLELALLRRYLDKDHLYRNGAVGDIPERVFIANRNNNEHRDEHIQNYSTLVGLNNVKVDDIRSASTNWVKQMGQPDFAALFASGFGVSANVNFLGIPDGLIPDVASDPNVDNSTQTNVIAARTTNTVFHTVSGSWFLDWNKANNVMRALIANDGLGLTAEWGRGTQDRYEVQLQHLGIGETLGYSNSVSQMGVTGNRSVQVWRNLIGDPTLRISVIKPPTNVRIEGTTLRWDEPTGSSGVEYHIYHASNFDDDATFSKITLSGSVTGNSFELGTLPLGDVYMVRAVETHEGPSGSYENASQGGFSQNKWTFARAINYNGGAVTHFEADTITSTPTTTPIDLSDPSLPTGISDEIFKTNSSLTLGSSGTLQFSIDSPNIVASQQFWVRMYFAEIDGNAQPQDRSFDVSIEGNVVESGLDPYTQAGGTFTGFAKTFLIVVDSDGIVDISLAGIGPIISAIEIAEFPSS